MLKSLLLTTAAFVFFMHAPFSQTIAYDIPFSSLNGMTLTSGDICSAPFTVEEAHQTTASNTWGCTWTSTGIGTATSVQIKLMFSVSDTINIFPTTLNGLANNMVNSGPPVNCAAGDTLYWDLDPANYNEMGLNTFLVNYSASGIYNQLDNLPLKGDPFMRITVNYVGAGIEDETGYTSKTLIKITDLLGRETIDESNKPLIYIYSDGSARRVLQME
jgi:hypothetical protein